MNKKIRSLIVAASAAVVLGVGSLIWFQSTETEVAQTKVDFHMDSDFGSSLIRVAKAEGIFTKHGIDAQLSDYADGPSAINAMVTSPSSEIALATSSGGSFVAFAPTNKDIKIISQLANNEDNYYWVVKEGKGNGTVAGLKGLKLGYPSISGYRTFLQLSLQDHGLTSADVELVPVEAAGFAAAMVSGKIDAHPSRVLVTELTVDALGGAAYELHDIGAYDWHNVLSTTNQTIKRHPEVLKAILDALIETQSVSYVKAEQARVEVAKSLKVDVSKVPENVISSSNVRLSNGLLRQLTINRGFISVDQVLPESAYFTDPRELIDAGPLLSSNPLVVHID